MAIAEITTQDDAAAFQDSTAEAQASSRLAILQDESPVLLLSIAMGIMSLVVIATLAYVLTL